MPLSLSHPLLPCLQAYHFSNERYEPTERGDGGSGDSGVGDRIPIRIELSGADGRSDARGGSVGEASPAGRDNYRRYPPRSRTRNADVHADGGRNAMSAATVSRVAGGGGVRGIVSRMKLRGGSDGGGGGDGIGVKILTKKVCALIKDRSTSSLEGLEVDEARLRHWVSYQ